MFIKVQLFITCVKAEKRILGVKGLSWRRRVGEKEGEEVEVAAEEEKQFLFGKCHDETNALLSN